MTDDPTKQPTALLGAKTWNLLAAAAVAATLVSWAAAGSQLAVGLVLFFTLLLVPLRWPFEGACLVLITSWVPVEDLTENDRTLLQSVGGLNASGMRLVGGFIGLTIAVWVLRDRLRRITLPPGFKFALVAYGAFVAWTAVSVLWSPAFVDGARAVAKFVFPVLVAAVIVADPRDLGPRKLIRVVGLVFAGALLLATLYGLLGVADRELLPTVETGWVAEYYGWAGWSIFGFFAGITAVLLLAVSFSGARPPLLGSTTRERLFVASVILLALIQIPLALKRISVAAAGIGITTLILLAGPRRLLAPIGVIGALAALLFFPPLVERNVYVPNATDAQPNIQQRESTTSQSVGAIGDLARGGSVDHVIKFEGRDRLWRAALDSLHGREYATGKGANAWNSARESVSGGGQLHGEPVRVLYELGAVGLVLAGLAFTGLFVGFVRMALASPKRSSARALGGGAAATLVLYLCTTITDNTLDYYLIGACIWTVFGLAIVGWNADRKSAPDGDERVRAASPSDQAEPVTA